MRTWILALSLASTAGAQQVYTVDQNDPNADYQSLMTAVQSVPAGSVLDVLSDCDDTGGGPDAAYFLGQDLVILGNGATIEKGVFVVTGGARVVLKDFTSPGAVDWDAVDVRDGQVLLENLVLNGGSDHDGVHAESGTLVVANECSVSAPGFSGGAPSRAVWADGATVVLKDCLVQTTYSPFWALSVQDDNSGLPGTLYCTSCTINGLIDERSGGAVVYLQRTVLDSTPLAIGQTATFNGEFFPYGWPGLVFLGLGLQPPTDRWNPRLLDSTGRLVFVGSGKWSLTGTLPNDPALLGVSLHVQQFDLTGMAWSTVESRTIGN